MAKVFISCFNWESGLCQKNQKHTLHHHIFCLHSACTHARGDIALRREERDPQSKPSLSFADGTCSTCTRKMRASLHRALVVCRVSAHSLREHIEIHYRVADVENKYGHVVHVDPRERFSNVVLALPIKGLWIDACRFSMQGTRLNI